MTAGDAERTQAAHESSADDEETNLPPFTDATWPAPLSRAAYVGIFGDIVDDLAPQTEADPAAVLLQLVAMFGNVIGRTAHFRVEADTHYLNLYQVLVGKTSKGRKGVSEGQARRFFEPIDTTWTDCQASGLSTGEGLIFVIRDPIEKQQPIRDGKRTLGHEMVVEDQGVSDKRLYVTESEFASTLKVMKREGNTLSPVMRNAWDGKTLRTLTKSSPVRATGPHVTIIGSITRNEVRRYLDATESANGFGNRFLWACVRRSKYLPDGGLPVAVEALIDRRREELARVEFAHGEPVEPHSRPQHWQKSRTATVGECRSLGERKANLDRVGGPGVNLRRCPSRNQSLHLRSAARNRPATSGVSGSSLA